jgi:chromosome segregation ATPase
MDVTRAIEKNIISGIIDLKDKKQEKTIEIVRSLSKEFLEDWKKRYHDLEKELDNLKNSLESFSIAHEILELKKQKSESEQEIEKTKQKKESNKLELSKIDLDKLKNEIKDNVKNIWDLEIY